MTAEGLTTPTSEEVPADAPPPKTPDTRQVVLAAVDTAASCSPISLSEVGDVIRFRKDASSSLLAASAIHGVLVAQGSAKKEQGLRAYLDDERAGGKRGDAATQFSLLLSAIRVFEADFHDAYGAEKETGKGGMSLDREALEALYDETDGHPIAATMPRPKTPQERAAIIGAERIIRFIAKTAAETKLAESEASEGSAGSAA
jgi:hypothetical protein